MRIEKELEINPIKFKKFIMIRKEKDKYLGQIITRTGWRPVPQQLWRTERASLKEQSSRSDQSWKSSRCSVSVV